MEEEDSEYRLEDLDTVYLNGLDEDAWTVDEFFSEDSDNYDPAL